MPSVGLDFYVACQTATGAGLAVEWWKLTSILGGSTMMQLFSRWRGALVAALLTAVLCVAPAKADVPFRITMNYDVTGTGQFNQYFNDFSETMTQIEQLLVSWSGPRAIEAQYSGFTIDVAFEDIDGEFGILAMAGPTDVLRWGGPGYAKHGTRGAVVRAGTSTYDTNDMAFMAATGLLRSTIMHETFHALGFPGVWDDFGYRSQTGAGFIGPNALAAYREATGQDFAPFVPVETGGGAGTAGGHWSGDDPYFFNPQTGVGELMIGFATENAFLSDVTLAQFRDLGYAVPSLGGGRSDDGWPSGPVTPKPPAPDGEDDDDGRSSPDGPGGPTDPTGPTGPGSPSWPGMPSYGDDGWVDWGGRGRAGFGGGIGGSGDLGGMNGLSGVPEPSSLLILAAAAGFHLAGRRRR